MEFQQGGCIRPPPPDHQSWYSAQFQYHSPNQHWAPPPPPPQQQQQPYLAHPYPAQHPYPQPPPPPNNGSHHPQMPQSYTPPQLNQEWHNSGWNQNQVLQYPVPNNGEDWAAKAREWAAAQSSSDNQFPQAQYTSDGRIEENQYSVANPQYSDGQHVPVAASSYQQYQPSIARPYQSSESSFSSGYVPDSHLPFNGRNGSLVGESTAFPHKESPPSTSAVHQPEVPSSYSSVAGKDDFAEQNKQFCNSPWAFSSAAHQQAQPAAVHRTVSMEQPHYVFSHQSADPPNDPSNQPLDFVPGFNRDHDQHVQSAYSQNSGIPVRGTGSPAVASIHSWNATAAPSVVYTPVHAPDPQVDPSLAIPSPVPGHSGPLFGRVSGQNFQPIGPSVGVPFGGAGAFPADGFGASGVSDRPKKPSVPNWLREELIKSKAVIATSAPEFSEDTKSVEEEVINKSFVKGNPDSKSVNSSRSMEEEDDEEDDVEIARTAAINHEIKRILTEVLFKVTDELFDEIATKVLSEEGSLNSRKVDLHNASPNHEISTSTAAVSIPKASAKVLITAKPDDNDPDDNRISTSSSAPRDLLGLGSYASDDDGDDDIQNIRVPNSNRNTIHQPSTIKIRPDNISVVGNDLSVANSTDTQENNSVLESHPGRMYPNGSSDNFKPDNEPNHHGSGKEFIHGTLGSKNSSKTDISADDHGVNNGAEVVYKANICMLKDNIEKAGTKTELSVESVGAKGTSDDTKVDEARNKSLKNDRYDRKGSSAGNDVVKEVRGDRGYVGGYESNRRQEERKVKKERTDFRDGSKDKPKIYDLKSAEKAVDTDSKRRSSHCDKKETEETEKDRTRGKEGYERKRDGIKDEKGERSRDKDSSRHKRRRSSSVGSRGRDRKNHAVDNRTKYSSDDDDESGEDSRRKSRLRKQKSSPSPVRSRRRQVSRSPHSKHSQHRHSPYSSLETTRGKRSRSRSPARRKR